MESKELKCLLKVMHLLLALLFILVIIGFIMMGITDNMCRKECESRGALYWEKQSNNNWFSLNDKCICFYENKTEAFNLNEK